MSTQFRDEISPLETALKEVVAQKLSDHCKVLVDKGVEQIVLDLRKKAAELVAQCSLEIQTI
jgi:histone H3/H4